MDWTRSFAATAGLLAALIFVAPAGAQAPATAPAPAPPETPAAAEAPVAPCPESTNQPPANSPVLIKCLQIVAHPENETLVDPQTYNFYIKEPRTVAARSQWAPYDENAIEADFNGLLKTGFLDNLWVESIDEPFANGVDAKHIVFNIEERSRVKAVDYQPADNGKLKVEVSKIESKEKDEGVEVRLDSFIDESTVRRVEGIIHDLYAEQGFNQAIVKTHTTAVDRNTPKLVRLTFTIDPGPEVRIKAIQFVGNKAFSDGDLRGQMKDNKEKRWYSFVSDGGVYHESKFSDDADRLGEFYKNNGYAAAQVGQPQTEIMETSPDGKTSWIRLVVPVDEGIQYRVGKFEIAGKPSLRPEALRAMFDIKEGDVYSLKKLRKGFEKVKQAYGAYGFWQWQPEPDQTPRGVDPETGKQINPGPPIPIMDISIKMDEGKQFFVNRLTFVGNTNTHDAVIRREMRVFEGSVFNSEALKDSVRRLNQLGYFKPLEGKEGEEDIVPTPGTDNKVDITLKLQEQNRNQLSFGAGVSEFEGFFGQLAFQTSNFLGRGETAGISLQKGSQASEYEASFTEPYLFNRPITAGLNLAATQFIYPDEFTQNTRGGSAQVGLPLANYTRLFLAYSYQDIQVYDINAAYLTPAVLNSSPYLADELLINQNGHRRVGKISPSIVFNTVNQPIFPTAGTRYTVGFDFAGVGGDTQYVSTNLDGVWYKPLTTRMSFGLHAQGEYIRPYGNTTTLAIFEKLFSGGEYSIRGYDLRTVSPRDPSSGVLIGGNKLLTFNAEYYINLFAQARLVLFYDAGQVQDIGQPFAWKQNVYSVIVPGVPFLSDPLSTVNFLTVPGAIHTIVTGQTSAFKTSTGVEVRFLMPVLNVPFRLISAYNPQRFGILNNSGVQTPRFTFRFAVGTTF